MTRPIAAVLVAAVLMTGSAFAGTKKYTYDSAGRLVKVDYGNNKGFVYRYDANGNLLSRQPLSAQPPARQRPAKPGGAAKQETSNDARPAAP